MTSSGSLKVGGLPLAEILPEARIHGADDVWFSSCTSDSRCCRRGDLFVAILGSQHDGHDHIAEAAGRGAAAIIAERLVPAGSVPVCVVPDSRQAFGSICHALAGFPSGRLNVVGVTGTNGKTTTTCLINSVFKAAGLRNGILNTLGYCDGIRTAPAALTTPGPTVLADYLARIRANGCTHGVVEVSSHALAQKRTAGMELDVACVTNVRHDHLDYHGTLQNYRDAKWQLMSQLRTGGLAVLNADDEVCRDYLDRLDGPVLTFGMRQPAEVTASLVERLPSEQTFLLQCGSDTIPVRTHIIGDHHIYNCLTATAVGLAYGIDLPTIVRGLEAVDQVPGRLQRIECGQPYQVYVDYAHTPDALHVSLSTLRETTRGRLICVFGAGGDRDRAKRPLMGKAVAELADMAVLTDDNPRSEDSNAIIQDILRGMHHATNVVVELDRASAIDVALSSARPGDAVLVAGKGHETVQVTGQQRVYFDDREVVRQWLLGATVNHGNGDHGNGDHGNGDHGNGDYRRAA